MLSAPAILGLLQQEFKDLDISNFNNRLILQKTIFILQEMGVKLGYNYNWYKYGPYSPSLTNDAYEYEANKDEYKKEYNGYRIHNKAAKTIDTYKSILKNSVNNSYFLELIASLLFLKKYYSVDGQKLSCLLKKSKPKYQNDAEINEALDKILLLMK